MNQNKMFDECKVISQYSLEGTLVGMYTEKVHRFFRESRRYFLLALILFVLVAGFELVKFNFYNNHNITGISDMNGKSTLSVFKDGNEVGQTFFSSRDNLSGFSILMSTFSRANTNNITVGIKEHNSDKDIHVWNLNASTLKNNSPMFFYLPSSISSENKNYYIYLKSDSASDDNGISVLLDPDNIYEKGSLFLNHTKTEMDMCFEVYYQHKTNLSDIVLKIIKWFISILFILGILLLVRNLAKGDTLPNALIKYRYLIAALLFTLFVALGIHGFSIGMWDKYIKSDKADTTLIMGQNRAITSDIWAISIPLTFNQIDAGFPHDNTDIMYSGANTLAMGLPTADITMIAKPFWWGYMFLGKERGLSWYFWFKLFSLFLVSFEVCSFLTRKKRLLSFLGAITIAFSPLVQWWFAQSITDAIIFMQWSIAAVIFYLRNHERIKIKILAAFLFFIGATGFILVLYPALQVPLGYLAILLGIGVILEFKNKLKLNRIDAILGFAVFVAVGLTVFRYFSITKDAYALLMSTVYPGARFETGGGYNVNNIFYYLFQWLLPFKGATMSNNCELSAIVPFFPVILLAFPFAVKYDLKNRFMKTAMFIYTVFLISWLFISYPVFVAKVTLFSYVTANRLVWTLGLLSVYLGVMILDTIIVHKPIGRGKALCLTAVVMIVFIYILSNYSGGGYLDAFRQYKMIPMMIALGTFALFSYFFLIGHKRMTAVILIGFIFISGLTVNPLAIGCDPIYQSDITKEIISIKEKNPESKWIFNDLFPYSNFLLAHGVKTFNAVNLYPDYEKWSIIDPQGKYKDLYNRYAHVGVMLSKNETYLELPHPDAIIVNLNIGDLKKLGIEYVVSFKPLEKFNNEHLSFKKLYTDEVNNLRIYKIQ